MGVKIYNSILTLKPFDCAAFRNSCRLEFHGFGYMLDSIEGTCVFTPEQVKGRMDKIHENMAALETAAAEYEQKAADAEMQAMEIQKHHKQLICWADLYKDASLEEKRMIASYIIRAVTLTRNYGINIEFNISEAQYLNGMDMGQSM